MNTPKAERNNEFYREAFASITTWSTSMFESECASHGIEEREEDSRFADRAQRLWDAYSEEKKHEFAKNYDDWLDA